MTNHPNRKLRYALITCNVNDDSSNRIVSRHATIRAAGIAYGKQGDTIAARSSYVAELRADGSYPQRVEALDLPAHGAAVNAWYDYQQNG